MSVHALAGKPAPREVLVNVTRLVSAYYTRHPDVSKAEERVAFGTSGHRGSSLRKNFNEGHVLAVSQAICEHREKNNIRGPLFMGMDTHALSEPAMVTAVEVFAANGVTIMIQQGRGYTPTPVISYAILCYNRDRKNGLADGIVITPFKYNPPHGGPADTDSTKQIEERANRFLHDDLKGVRRIPYEKALAADTTHTVDFIGPYTKDLDNVVDMKAIAEAGLKIGVDPLGGAAVAYWAPIAERFGLNINIVNKVVDPTFSFMPLDKDGKIRMDCSSPYAMSGLIGLKDRFDIAFGNDPDADRHGIVTRGKGFFVWNSSNAFQVVV